MKIILSRKGFDSQYGGVPSPILPDGTLLPFSIPDPHGPICYSDIGQDNSAGGLCPVPDDSLAQRLERATRGRLTGADRTHLDPDLNTTDRPRAENWRPAFGQTGSAEGHLRKQGIGRGDLFLFFGWFRQYDADLRPLRNAPDLHVLFGWLLVEEVISIGPHTEAFRKDWPCYREHPHALIQNQKLNSLYRAAEQLPRWITSPRGPDETGNQDTSLFAPLPGGGLFPTLNATRTLTATTQQANPTGKRSLWQLPHSFHRPGQDGPVAPLSYHGNPKFWTPAPKDRRKNHDWLLQSVPKGQEFVLDLKNRSGLKKWIRDLFAED
ncbi:hypothetical protein [Kiloniella sp. b19]|uniref:Nmad3 family putative nucleotide modification protein n=1 Tax=Kiloniella sp. GXU_MW_B19 TaxID=3141326 RepID=UPI0031DD1E3F